MSALEAERLASDLKASADLRAEMKQAAAGLGISGIVVFAKQRGYNVEASDVKTYIEDKLRRDLTDEQLEQIAGGKGGSSTSQTTNVATTAEAVSQAVAATVAAAAESVGAAVDVLAVGAVIVT